MEVYKYVYKKNNRRQHKKIVKNYQNLTIFNCFRVSILHAVKFTFFLFSMLLHGSSYADEVIYITPHSLTHSLFI